MAVYTTEFLFIDTGDFENAADVTDCIDQVKGEIASLCDDCPNAGFCNNHLLTPGDGGWCKKDLEYAELDQIIQKLKPYHTALSAAEVA